MFYTGASLIPNCNSTIGAVIVQMIRTSDVNITARYLSRVQERQNRGGRLRRAGNGGEGCITLGVGAWARQGMSSEHLRRLVIYNALLALMFIANNKAPRRYQLHNRRGVHEPLKPAFTQQLSKLSKLFFFN